MGELYSGVSLLNARLATQNARHLAAQAGVAYIRAQGMTKEQVEALVVQKGHQRGFYGALPMIGYQAITHALNQLKAGGDVARALAEEIERTELLDECFGGIDTASEHELLGLRLTVYPGLDVLPQIQAQLPAHTTVASQVRRLVEENIRTPADQASPICLAEDHPGWASERPDIRNLRGNMAAAVREAELSVEEISRQVEAQYGAGTMKRIAHVIVVGIGANDMYLRSLGPKVSQDTNSQRTLSSIFEPTQLESIPPNVTMDNTLWMPESRSGGTQETMKVMYWGKKEGRVGPVAGYANQGLLKEWVEQEQGICSSMPGRIGGRYMWAKGQIVLEPFRLAASDQAWDEYTGAMIEADNIFWPVGPNTTILNLATHMYLLMSAYNCSGFFVASNDPILEQGLREPLQLHNEAVGKVANRAFAFGPGMDMLPFAHAGADGLLGAAISALHYGAFIFDSSYDHEAAVAAALTAQDLLGKEAADHTGLTKQLLRMACVFPNQAKFSFSGGPNFMVTMDGTSYRNLATLTFFYQNLMYPYLLMNGNPHLALNGTNPDSNPNVDVVRRTTKTLLKEMVAAMITSPTGETPIQVIARVVRQIMS